VRPRFRRVLRLGRPPCADSAFGHLTARWEPEFGAASSVIFETTPSAHMTSRMTAIVQSFFPTLLISCRGGARIWPSTADHGESLLAPDYGRVCAFAGRDSAKRITVSGQDTGLAVNVQI